MKQYLLSIVILVLFIYPATALQLQGKLKQKNLVHNIEKETLVFHDGFTVPSGSKLTIVGTGKLGSQPEEKNLVTVFVEGEVQILGPNSKKLDYSKLPQISLGKVQFKTVSPKAKLIVRGVTLQFMYLQPHSGTVLIENSYLKASRFSTVQDKKGLKVEIRNSIITPKTWQVEQPYDSLKNILHIVNCVFLGKESLNPAVAFVMHHCDLYMPSPIKMALPDWKGPKKPPIIFTPNQDYIKLYKSSTHKRKDLNFKWSKKPINKWRGLDSIVKEKKS